MNQSTINLRLTGKIILLSTLFFSLDNYGFNGLFNKMYGWTDIVVSLFAKKDRKQFLMMQQSGENNTNGEVSASLPESSFPETNFLDNEEKIKKYREKFIKYNMKIKTHYFSSHPDDPLKMGENKEEMCFDFLVELIKVYTNLKDKELINSSFEAIKNVKNTSDRDFDIFTIGQSYDIIIGILRKIKSNKNISISDKEFVQQAEALLLSDEPSLFELFLRKDISLSVFINFYLAATKFKYCTNNNIYSDFFRHK